MTLQTSDSKFIGNARKSTPKNTTVIQNNYSRTNRQSVVIKNKKLVLRNFELIDDEIVEYFSELEEKTIPQRLEKAIKVGVSALKTVNLTDRIDYIEREFNNLNTKFSNAVDKAIQQLNNKYEEVYGEKGKFKEIVQSHFGENGFLVKELLDPNKDGSPLNELGSKIRTELTELRQQLGINEREKEIKNKTTLKGFDFQNLCENTLGKAGRVSGDLIENTSEQTGILKNSKQGDFVITITECYKRIVFEVKDVSTISVNAILKILKESIENRSAEYGVLVIRSVNALPQSLGWFQEIEPNMLVCALESTEEDALHEEHLLIAYKWARMKTITQSLEGKRVDSVYVKNKIKTIANKIDKLRNIKTDCTNIENSARNIKELTHQLTDEIHSDLSEINNSMALTT